MGHFVQKRNNEKQLLKLYRGTAVEVRCLSNQNTRELSYQNSFSLIYTKKTLLSHTNLFIYKTMYNEYFKAHLSASCTMYKKIFLRIVYWFLPCRNL